MRGSQNNAVCCSRRTQSAQRWERIDVQLVPSLERLCSGIALFLSTTGSCKHLAAAWRQLAVTEAFTNPALLQTTTIMHMDKPWPQLKGCPCMALFSSTQPKPTACWHYGPMTQKANQYPTEPLYIEQQLACH